MTRIYLIFADFICVHLFNLRHLRSINHLDYNMNQFTDVNQFNLPIHIDFWGFIVRELVTEGSYNGVVVGMPERAKNIWHDQAGEADIVSLRPLFQQFTALLFGFAIEVVALFLGRRGEEDVGS